MSSSSETATTSNLVPATSQEIAAVNADSPDQEKGSAEENTAANEDASPEQEQQQQNEEDKSPEAQAKFKRR